MEIYNVYEENELGEIYVSSFSTLEKATQYANGVSVGILKIEKIELDNPNSTEILI